jgi:MraZ protein
MDDKGRVSIPSKFREALQFMGQNTLIVTTSFLDHCLEAFPMDAWIRQEHLIKSLPHYIPEVIQYKRFYISSAQECPIDRQGRILLPANLRKYAQLQRDVIFAGMVDYFEIWSPDLWPERPKNPEAILKALTSHTNAHQLQRDLSGPFRMADKGR